MPEIVSELSIVSKKWGRKSKATLVISIDTLANILFNENAVIADVDVSRLLGALHSYAVKANSESTEQNALDDWENEVQDLEVEED